MNVLCQWEDKMVRERTGHPPSYAVATKMKPPTLPTHSCCPRASLRDCSSSYGWVCGRGVCTLRYGIIQWFLAMLPVMLSHASRFNVVVIMQFDYDDC